MDVVEHDISIRIYDGPLKVETMTTMNKKTFRLLSLPLFFICKIRSYIRWMLQD